MPRLTDTGPKTPRSAVMWVQWAHSARDGLVHAFPVEDSERDRWPQAVCTHTAPPAALGASTMAPRCPGCVLSIPDPAATRSATACPGVVVPPPVHRGTPR